MATPNTQETKQSLRKSLQETRRKTQLGSFDAEQLTKRALFELSKTTGDVAIYMSLPEEPPTENLIHAASSVSSQSAQIVRYLLKHTSLPRCRSLVALSSRNYPLSSRRTNL